MNGKLKTLLLTLLLAGTAAFAQSPAALAQSEQKMSEEIFHSYMSQRDTLAAMNKLRHIHKELSATAKTPEISNLLSYIGLCISQLEAQLQRPLSPTAIAKVSDLTNSIAEGSHYIALQSSNKARRIASR